MLIINAKIRKKQGKGPSRYLRLKNKCPAIIYGGKKEPLPIELDHDKIWSIQEKAEFYNKTLILLLEGRKEKVKIQSIQRHVFKPKITHIDFIRI